MHNADHGTCRLGANPHAWRPLRSACRLVRFKAKGNRQTAVQGSGARLTHTLVRLGAASARWRRHRHGSPMSSKYAGRPDAVRALVQPDRVHRDLYIDEELFALEREHFFSNTWNYVGHDSQVPQPG